WVRIRPGHPAPGTGPVVLCEDGAPLLDRETWLETSAPRPVPSGFAGLILKGREAAGLGGETDGLDLLAQCPDPGRVILDAGLGPITSGSAAALGAAGVLVSGALMALPELRLPNALASQLDRADDEITVRSAGWRIGNSATATVLRNLANGDDPWSLHASHGATTDLDTQLWSVDQGIALARGLADRHGSLRDLLRVYVDAWTSWGWRATQATAIEPGRPTHSAAALGAPGCVAAAGGEVGSAVLWQEAAWLDRPVQGNIQAAVATGLAVVASAADFDAARAAVHQRALAANVPTSPPPPPSAPAVDNQAPPATAPTDTPTRTTGAPAIAIVGMGCRMPGAENLDQFWSNIKQGVSSIIEVPADRWIKDLYFDPDRSIPDKTYCSIGGFITDFTFNSKRFRIPPRVTSQVDPVQQIALHAVYDALRHANLQTGKRDKTGRAFDRERCAVIIGNSLGGELKDDYAVRLGWFGVRKKLEDSDALAGMDPATRSAMLDKLEGEYKHGLPKVDEDSMPGELSNVIAGRIANAFDLRGPNFTTDAACASSMAAIQAAVKGLQDREFDYAITGGSDRSMNVPTYVKFSKIGALSPDHSSPFDESANGFVMGEGAGIMVLRRLEDAIADGDTIYSIIRGIGASSDGKGKGITAPNPIGQRLALERAYKSAGVEAHTIDLLEAHGTSTVVGDSVELETFSTFVGPGHRDDLGPIRVGSVKSMIGHLKSAAGAAACIKATLALHEGTLPPSLGFHKARPGISIDTVPVQVQTKTERWPARQTPRRAGVSAFGFGGTNFHIVLEAWEQQPLPASPPFLPTHVPARPEAPTANVPDVAASIATAPAVAASIATAPAVAASMIRSLPEGIWATSASNRAELLDNLKALREGRPAHWHPSDPMRIAGASDTDLDRNKKLDRAIKVVTKGQNPELLRARNIYFEDGPNDGRVCFLFTGQGSQYIDMGLDLANAFPIVAETFAQADRIVAPTLGKGITDFIMLREGEDKEQKELTLRQTEYSQPATLTLDVAILRLLASYGVFPDLVAGHSLGEYGAAVASGIMDFEQALLAVSARGREMASIRLDDPGKMAGVASSTETVEEVLADVAGYVIAANKNCPSQTVIAGASDAVDEAMERFQARGITVYPLPVSHAFHSSIVAPASGPLRNVLAKLGLKPPRRPITTNVTADYYPTGEQAVPTIIDTLAKQISSPVEWTAQLERMYNDGARIFVECGPKRALTGFVTSSLKRRPHRAFYTNHPKRGGVWTFRDCLAGLLAAGIPIADPVTHDIPDLFATPIPRKATTEAVTAHMALVEHTTEATADITRGILHIVAAKSGYDVDELDQSFELEADLGIDTVKQAEIFAVVRDTYGIPIEDDFSFAQHRTLRSVIRWAAERTGATRPTIPTIASVPTPAHDGPGAIDTDAVSTFLESAARSGLQIHDPEGFARALLPSVQGLLAAAFAAAQSSLKTATPTQVVAPPVVAPPVVAPPVVASAQPSVKSTARRWPSVVCSGASVGLPGGDEVFAADNLTSILRGDNRISHIGDDTALFMDLDLVRLVKDPETGLGSFLPVTKTNQVIRLAGRAAAFDVCDWGVPAAMKRAFDITTQLVIAAGLEALRDAGIPLQRTYKLSASGKRVPQGWSLPESLRDETGVIFASAFPGHDSLVRYVTTNGDDGEGHFDRRFMFNVLSMGHSQLAQFIGARGPNTQINAACASATQAICIAQDWIRVGRCKRVVVVSADNVTSKDLLQWYGGAFMAAGAASTHDVVEEAALPFDARRNGMIMGMGAHGMIIETAEAAADRGVTPVAELMASTSANSAFHGTRLNPDHIAQCVGATLDEIWREHGISRDEIAESALFMSHETYTPARGGSAQAEIAALTATFGDRAKLITITNTKGYTGHAMGAGIEETVAVKAMQYGIMPPVANFKEPDLALGDLRIARGERRRAKFALRLAAGFGSQFAFAVWRNISIDD
ncbi:MAG: acyl transferase domain-containing protein/acyl carrier protein, partial [Kiritimatiellia bacterium]